MLKKEKERTRLETPLKFPEEKGNKIHRLVVIEGIKTRNQ